MACRHTTCIHTGMSEVRVVPGSVRITVGIGLNNHWTDMVCSNDERQRSIQPNQAKSEWQKTQHTK